MLTVKIDSFGEDLQICIFVKLVVCWSLKMQNAKPFEYSVLTLNIELVLSYLEQHEDISWATAEDVSNENINHIFAVLRSVWLGLWSISEIIFQDILKSKLIKLDEQIL